MIIHLVKQGEKLSEIAARYGTTTDAIVDRNRHRPAVQLPSGARVFASLSAGDELRVLGEPVLPPEIVVGAPYLGGSSPASVFCFESGGQSSEQLTKDGVVGMCLLPDGTFCDEWTLYRGGCPGWPGAPNPEPRAGGSCASRRMDTDPVTGACIPWKNDPLAERERQKKLAESNAEIKTEAWISKPVLAGGLAVLGLAIGAGALMFWPKK